MHCYRCFDMKINSVPLLKCGHYLCSRCYVNLKTNNLFCCYVCNEKLIRRDNKRI